MIHLKLPEFESMERIRVRLDKSRLMIFKDGRKVNPSQKTIIPLELQEHEGKEGIYIICINGKVGYVGATTNFAMRMRSHVYLKKNLDIKYVFFLGEKDNGKRLILEMIYKYYYFGKVKVEWNYAK